MNPFDQAPDTPPVSLDPPNALIQPAPRRGRMALVAVATAGLMGVGLVGVSQFASADRPEIDPDAAAQPLATPAPDDDVDDAEPTDAPAEVDGQIVIDDGDGEPIVIDLEGGTVDGQSFEAIAECIGLPAFGEGKLFDIEAGEFPLEKLEAMLEDFPFEEFGDFEHFGEPGEFGVFGVDGTHVTVLGPDGPSVIEFGDGDGSVTITQENGEVTIDTEGSATVKQIDEMFGAIEFPELESFDIEQILDDFPFDKFEQMLPDDFDGFGDFGAFELPTEIQDCLDGVGAG